MKYMHAADVVLVYRIRLLCVHNTHADLYSFQSKAKIQFNTIYIYTCVYSHNGIVRMVWQAVKYIYILTVSYIQSMDTIISCVDTVLDDYHNEI